MNKESEHGLQKVTMYLIPRCPIVSGFLSLFYPASCQVLMNICYINS